MRCGVVRFAGRHGFVLARPLGHGVGRIHRQFRHITWLAVPRELRVDVPVGVAIGEEDKRGEDTRRREGKKEDGGRGGGEDQNWGDKIHSNALAVQGHVIFVCSLSLLSERPSSGIWGSRQSGRSCAHRIDAAAGTWPGDAKRPRRRGKRTSPLASIVVTTSHPLHRPAIAAHSQSAASSRILWPSSRVQPVQLNQLLHHSNDLTALQRRSGTLHLVRDQLVHHPSEPRDQHPDASPAPEPQPAVYQQSPPQPVELNGTREQQQRVDVES